LTTAVLGRNSEGHLIGKAGVMATVINGGDVRAGDVIAVDAGE
jgi:MOSC domain-containing protein YiiM